ncbi:1,4-alpha-glucan branching protein GlgB [Pseudooceanicola sediminis]|uniref:1,4-alpha-glucan branching enzyme GlgB n=1 Tax=Pseudooceanicola sediminis TaxID=2211117 RepID=A0A399J7T6_9RHOB|nr:1,4-alpha-glucan branching protein GlgB [Pseudooceanicola sediminis]KAA2315506.1 1,4-alpha-glucan branching protein GlgB [Puniceibacterium sp. HSS470]RII40289.1 1,4-alpha-glucan branching protein GlgB [Pseudooceanicola sediminis]|tara:strand:- start:95871 stop:98075 length:2205 start_codon:yes stop_codon:yes gene_type:complete
MISNSGEESAHTPDTAAFDALRQGRHGAPFDILGLHGDTLVAFDPEAERMWCLTSGSTDAVEMQAEGGGVFILRGVPKSVAAGGGYMLRAEGHGRTQDRHDPYRFSPVLGELDEYLISEGRHLRLWQKLGARPETHEGVAGTVFAVWAPNARRVAIVGDFNGWSPLRHPMRVRGASGVWEIFLPDVGPGAAYKYDILGPDGASLPQKADPVAFGSEHPPAQASIVRRLPDRPAPEARAARAHRQAVSSPISIYEVHLGSWRRKVEDDRRRLSYDELAVELVAYTADMGFTHIELMPVSEFPFDGSWGYQPVGLYAPTIRHGTPREFAAFVAATQAAGLGLILDWVPGHFPTDPHGLGWLDGTPLYQYADPREGFHRDWNTLIYDYSKRQVRNYLIANAIYWLTEYGVDGLRVDAVASMLYRDYSRPHGEWVPNVHGGRENLEAISFLREMNVETYGAAPGIMTVAEESTSFPGVSRPVHEDGLGFGYKWNMGWMNDTLAYMHEDPIHRAHHHGKLTFGLVYAFSENFILPISHDEVVHGKGSMLGKMPGQRAEQFANLRAYYGFMWGHPGKKLLFMGCEFGQEREWNHDISLDWHLLDDPAHAGVQNLVRDLNRLYRDEPALHRDDLGGAVFDWLVERDSERSVLAFLRRGEAEDAEIAVVCNFTPVERCDYALPLPEPGVWQEVLNTDAEIYGGGNRGNMGSVRAEAVSGNAMPAIAVMTIPPLSVIFLRRKR